MTRASTLLITHTDRDGLLSGAALLRALADVDGLSPDDVDGPDVVLTQGAFLADELEEVADAGRRYSRVFVCDTYWHPPHAARLAAVLPRLLSSGGTVTWLDHHPSTVAAKDQLRDALPLGPLSLLVGDREGQFEAVTLVARAFGAGSDPVVADLVRAATGGWQREGRAVPEGAARWLDVIDGLARSPELAPDVAAGIVRGLARGVDTPVPSALAPLVARSCDVACRTAEVTARDDWPRLPSVGDGYGLFLDLSTEPLAAGYPVVRALFDRSARSIDYFVVAEHPGLVHYVSGPRARRERDRLERGRPPGLRVSTLHKGSRARTASWRARQGLDLAYLTRRHPVPDVIEAWIDAHPYLVKGTWRDGLEVTPALLFATAEGVGRAMRVVLERYGWTDTDRHPWG